MTAVKDAPAEKAPDKRVTDYAAIGIWVAVIGVLVGVVGVVYAAIQTSFSESQVRQEAHQLANGTNTIVTPSSGETSSALVVVGGNLSKSTNAALRGHMALLVSVCSPQQGTCFPQGTADVSIGAWEEPIHLGNVNGVTGPAFYTVRIDLVRSTTADRLLRNDALDLAEAQSIARELPKDALATSTIVRQE